MRLILTILLIGLFNAEGQIVINASAPYRPRVVAANLLLDDYPNAAAAYSLRKLDKDYTGSAIRVRKDTTGQPEQDIGFTASGDLDTAALKSFLNARSGFVTTWYSQGDSTSVNFTQSTQANQPRIALNGVIDRLNGKPIILYDVGGGADFLTIASSTQKFAFLHQSGLSSVIFVGAAGGTTDDRIIIDNHGTASANIGYSMYQTPTAKIYTAVARGVGGTFVSLNTTSNNFIKVDTLGIYYNELDNANGTAANRNKLYYNNGNAITNNTSTNAASSSNASFNLRIGVLSNNSSFFGFSGYMTEIIFYKGDKTASRTGIRDNINTYYGIY